MVMRRFKGLELPLTSTLVVFVDERTKSKGTMF